MREVQDLIAGNYVRGEISPKTFHTAVAALHKAFAESNDLSNCQCLSCNYKAKQ